MTVSRGSLLSRAMYVGPPIRTLHEEYAKGGRIDERAPVVAASEVTVAAPPDEVWRVLTDVPGWPGWVPGVREAALDGAGPAADLTFRWVLNGMRIRSTLAVVTPGREIAWTGRLAGSRGVHRFLLRPAPGGGTVVRSEESIGGALIGLYYSSEKLSAVLRGWLGALKSTVEGER
ncbi:SRPBCC family protein [Kitasatospora sp. NPDC127067]|uniref:SRPBCC family protein n=1 Tax=Kitasatospora sp. NPDC127067 TaxID=3347126 RepID=UPI00364F0760